MILLSNDRTSASKKINGMGLIRTLAVSTTAFERTKEKFYGFQQTEMDDYAKDGGPGASLCIIIIIIIIVIIIAVSCEWRRLSLCLL